MGGPRREKGPTARCRVTVARTPRCFPPRCFRAWAWRGWDPPSPWKALPPLWSSKHTWSGSWHQRCVKARWWCWTTYLCPQRRAGFKQLIEGLGCELVYLAPYSPELNPIEEAFSKMKDLIRKAEARTKEALLEAIGAAIFALSARDARGYFEHCGYRASVQSLP